MKSRSLNFGLPALALAVAVAISGCAGQQQKGPDSEPTPVDTSAAERTPVTAGEGVEADAMRELESVGDVVYFDYDRDEIKPEFRALIAAHANYLRANPEVRVKLGGHADERGSREYNLALSERRAKAVYTQLMLAGVSESQLSTAAYGEEYPAAEGHTETSWSKNRRVEFDYPGTNGGAASR